MKILVVNTVPYKKNGITRVIESYYQQMQMPEFEMDFAGITDVTPEIKSEIQIRGGKSFVLSERNRNPLKYIFHLVKICKAGRYDILDIHGNSSSMIIEMIAGILAGIHNRIAHGHSVHSNNMFLHRLLRPILNCTCTYRIACTEAAGNFLFGRKEFCVFKNPIDVSKFAYSQEDRVFYRKALDIENDLVFGYVATLTESKNHLFLIQVIKELIVRQPNIKVVLVGKGNEEESIRKAAKEYAVEARVIFLGERSDVSRLMNAFDFVLFPSKFEGLGISAIEAQANGLPVLAASDGIDKSIKINPNFHFLPLGNAKQWAQEVMKMSWARYEDGNQAVFAAGYDIASQAESIRDIYRKLAK